MATAMLVCGTALAGCGGSSAPAKVSPSAYVSHVCTYVGSWQHYIQSGSAELQRKLATAPDAAAAKQDLQTLVAGWVASSETVVRNLRAAGVPDVKEGKAIATALVLTFASAAEDLRSLDGQVKGLPTEGTRLRDAMTHLSSSLESSLGKVGTGLQGLRSEELRSAAAQSAACQSLGATSG